jgi:hypothetical protein
MNEQSRNVCSACHGTGYRRKRRDHGVGDAFELLLGLIPFFCYLMVCGLLYALGILSASFLTNHWVGLLVSTLVGLYLAVACLITIGRFILPERIPCEGCKGTGLLERS